MSHLRDQIEQTLERRKEELRREENERLRELGCAMVLVDYSAVESRIQFFYHQEHAKGYRNVLSEAQ